MPPGPDADPEQVLEQWIATARGAGAPLPEAMALATTRPDGSPAVRMVLLRQLGPGLVFFTDTGSDKGVDLGHERRAAVVIPDKETLVAAVGDLERRYGDDVPRPERWSGNRLSPEVFEFWEEGPDRLHDRFRYRRSGEMWTVERLSP